MDGQTNKLREICNLLGGSNNVETEEERRAVSLQQLRSFFAATIQPIPI